MFGGRINNKKLMIAIGVIIIGVVVYFATCECGVS